MKNKKFYIFVTFLSFLTIILHSKSNNFKYSNQEFSPIKDLLLLKKMSNEHCHDFLILNDWNYITTEHKSRVGSFQPSDKTTYVFKNNSANIKINIVEIVLYNPGAKKNVVYKKTRGLNIIAESSDSYKFLLKDLYNNNFKIIGKEVDYGKLDIATSTSEEIVQKMRKDYVNTKTTSKEYSNGKDKITVFIDVFEKLNKNYDFLKRYEYRFSL